MLRIRLFGIAILITVLAPISVATAQPVAPGGGLSRPSFSPYLNLANRGNNPSLNYLGIVRPQLQAQQQFGQLQQQYQQSNQGLQSQLNQLSQGVDASLPLTGHVATFNNTGSYFSRHPVTGGGGAGRAGGFGTQRFGNNAGGTIGRAPSGGSSSGSVGGGGSSGVRR